MKATSGYWRGLEVLLTGADGTPLPEFAHPDSDPNGNHHISYVQCTPGEVFAIAIRRGCDVERGAGLKVDFTAKTYADGQYLSHNLVFAHASERVVEGYNKRIGDDHKWKLFMFGIKDESTPASGDVDDQHGTVKLVIAAGSGMGTGEVAVTALSQPSFMGNRERGLHTFVSGKVAGPGKEFEMCKFVPDPTAPEIVFEFKYRTSFALTALGVTAPIPVPDVIVISDSEDEDALSTRGGSVQPKAPARTAVAGAPPTPRATPKKKRKWVEVFEEDGDGNRRVMSRREIEIGD